jgi:hypothetical protein
MPRRKNSPKRSLENVHKEYDENGRWVQEQNRIKGALRQAFRMSPQMWETLERSRVELPPELKKDGTPKKRPRIRYKCAICGELFQKKYGRSSGVQVDHIEPVVPLHKKEKDMTYDELAERIFCGKNNLQTVCSIPLSKNNGKPSCHKIKTDEENYIRNELTKIIAKNEINFLNKRCPIAIDGFLNTQVEKLKEEFKIYLEEKERKRLAKEERKRLREEKRKAKNG